MTKDTKIGISITDIKQFKNILSCLTRFVPGGKITITPDGIEILAKTTISRVIIKANCGISDAPVSLIFNQINKFDTLLSSIKHNQCEFFFDTAKQNITYKSDELSFKVNCVKEDIIKDYIDTVLKMELIPQFTFNIEFDTLNNIIDNATALIDEPTPKFKIYQDEVKNKMVYIENESVSNTLSNKLKQVIGTTMTEQKLTVTGDGLVVDLDRLKIINQLRRHSAQDSVVCSIVNDFIICYDIILDTGDDVEQSTVKILTSSLKL